MRIIVNGLALFLFVMTASAQTAPSNVPTETADEQTAFCPSTHNLEVEPSTQYWLEGVIGSKIVKMYLNRGGSGVVGLFYEPNGDWKPVLLGGMWKPTGIDLTAGADSAAFDPETRAPIGFKGSLLTMFFSGGGRPRAATMPSLFAFQLFPKPNVMGGALGSDSIARNGPFHSLILPRGGFRKNTTTDLAITFISSVQTQKRWHITTM
jgi:hypothetical protein